MGENTPFAKFEKCANYAVIGTTVMNTVLSMGRFKGIPRDRLISGIYNKMKARAAAK